MAILIEYFTKKKNNQDIEREKRFLLLYFHGISCHLLLWFFLRTTDIIALVLLYTLILHAAVTEFSKQKFEDVRIRVLEGSLKNLLSKFKIYLAKLASL